MTPAYGALIAQAQPTAQPWRVALGLGVIAAAYLAGMAALGAVIWLALGIEQLEMHLARVGAGADPLSVLLLLSTFLGGWAGLWLVMRFLHRRGMWSLFGRAPVVLRDFVAGVLAMTVIGGLLTLAMAPMLPPLTLTADTGLWLRLLPLALLGVLIQTGAEEAVFRGYLQGHLAARFASPLVWLLVPMVLFGLAHVNPGEAGPLVWLVVAATGLFGLIAGDLTARSGALGLAWGLHFANNVMVLLLVNVSGTLDGLALLRPPGADLPPQAMAPLILADMALLVVVWLGCRLWLRRR